MTRQFPNHILTATALRAMRGDRLLFDNVNIELNAATALRVEGANGVGKTTLLRMLIGLGFVSYGEVLWKGNNVLEQRAVFNSAVHYLGHQTALKLALSPFENLRFVQAFSAARYDPAAITRALTYFDLQAQQGLPCHALSAGQKQRVALARLLLIKKPLWVLDEAFTALDRNVISRVEALMQEHLQCNGSIIFTSHQELQDNGLQYQRLLLTRAVPR